VHQACTQEISGCKQYSVPSGDADWRVYLMQNLNSRNWPSRNCHSSGASTAM